MAGADRNGRGGPAELPKKKVPPCDGTFLALPLELAIPIRALALTVRVLLAARILLLLAGLLAAALLLAGLLTRVLILLARVLVLIRHRGLRC